MYVCGHTMRLSIQKRTSHQVVGRREEGTRDKRLGWRRKEQQNARGIYLSSTWLFFDFFDLFSFMRTRVLFLILQQGAAGAFTNRRYKLFWTNARRGHTENKITRRRKIKPRDACGLIYTRISFVVSSGGQNFEQRNLKRPIFRKFKIANIKITKDELFYSFVFEFIFFIFKKNFEHLKYLIIFQLVTYWFPNWFFLLISEF